MSNAKLQSVLDRIDADFDNSLERLFVLLRIKSISADPAFADDCKAAANHLAKDIATLARDSGGRFLFGVGAGWMREETEIMGGDFPRGWRQIKDSVAAMKAEGPTTAVFGMTRRFELRREAETCAVGVFPDRDSALEWLGLQPSVDLP